MTPMAQRPLPRPIAGPLAALVVALAIAAGCGGASELPPGPRTPSSRPLPITLADFERGFCDAMQAMFRGIGNPDTGNDSELSYQMDQAIKRGDLRAAGELAAQIRAELAVARQHAADAGTWPEGAEVAANLDVVVAAFDAAVEAKRVSAGKGFDAADAAGQRVFGERNAYEAWIAMVDGYRRLIQADPTRRRMDCFLPADPRNPGPAGSGPAGSPGGTG